MKKLLAFCTRNLRALKKLKDLNNEKRQQEVATQINRTILGSTINFLLYEWMQTLDFPKLPAQFREMSINSVDALLLSGTLDGRTYVSSGKEIAKGRKIASLGFFLAIPSQFGQCLRSSLLDFESNKSVFLRLLFQ